MKRFLKIGIYYIKIAHMFKPHTSSRAMSIHVCYSLLCWSKQDSLSSCFYDVYRVDFLVMAAIWMQFKICTSVLSSTFNQVVLFSKSRIGQPVPLRVVWDPRPNFMLVARREKWRDRSGRERERTHKKRQWQKDIENVISPPTSGPTHLGL